MLQWDAWRFALMRWVPTGALPGFHPNLLAQDDKSGARFFAEHSNGERSGQGSQGFRRSRSIWG